MANVARNVTYYSWAGLCCACVGASDFLRMGTGSEDPDKRVLGPKYYNINGIWALNPYYLGPWTLRSCAW